jgi:hypothetical protein
LTIQPSKGRSRLVAIRGDLVAGLRVYAAKRQRLVRKHRRGDPAAFFLRLDASPLAVASASPSSRWLGRFRPINGGQAVDLA